MTTSMIALNLIVSTAVVAGLVAVCRMGHALAGRTRVEPEPVEAAAEHELKRAA